MYNENRQVDYDLLNEFKTYVPDDNNFRSSSQYMFLKGFDSYQNFIKMFNSKLNEFIEDNKLNIDSPELTGYLGGRILHNIGPDLLEYVSKNKDSEFKRLIVRKLVNLEFVGSKASEVKEAVIRVEYSFGFADVSFETDEVHGEEFNIDSFTVVDSGSARLINDPFTDQFAQKASNWVYIVNYLQKRYDGFSDSGSQYSAQGKKEEVNDSIKSISGLIAVNKEVFKKGLKVDDIYIFDRYVSSDIGTGHPGVRISIKLEIARHDSILRVPADEVRLEIVVENSKSYLVVNHTEAKIQFKGKEFELLEFMINGGNGNGIRGVEFNIKELKSYAERCGNAEVEKMLPATLRTRLSDVRDKFIKNGVGFAMQKNKGRYLVL